MMPRAPCCKWLTSAQGWSSHRPTVSCSEPWLVTSSSQSIRRRAAPLNAEPWVMLRLTRYLYIIPSVVLVLLLLLLLSLYQLSISTPLYILQNVYYDVYMCATSVSSVDSTHSIY
eukprot:Rmarinus@m.15958